MIDACKQFGCERDATHVAEVNAPVRGHGYDAYCEEHAAAARDRPYVRAVGPREAFPEGDS